MVRKFFIFLLYCLFALCITGVFLVILFPRERISAWVATMIEERIPGYTCSIDDIRYVHPLKLRLYRVKVASQDKGITIPIDSLLLSFPAVYPIDQVGVSGVMFGGNVAGDVSFDNLNGSRKININNLEVSQIYFDEIDMIKRGVDRPTQGALSFSGRASVDPKRPRGLRMTGDVRIRDFSTTLRRPIFAQNEVFFDEVTADMSISPGVLQFSDGQATGSLLRGDFSGTVKEAWKWQHSTLDFSGGVVPQQDLLKDDPNLSEALDLYYQRYNTRSIPFQASGTLSEPQFHLSDSPAADAAQKN